MDEDTQAAEDALRRDEAEADSDPDGFEEAYLRDQEEAGEIDGQE